LAIDLGGVEKRQFRLHSRTRDAGQLTGKSCTFSKHLQCVANRFLYCDVLRCSTRFNARFPLRQRGKIVLDGIGGGHLGAWDFALRLDGHWETIRAITRLRNGITEAGEDLRGCAARMTKFNRDRDTGSLQINGCINGTAHER